MAAPGRSLLVLAVSASLVLAGAPTRIAAQPSEPVTEWVQTSDDSVITADLLRDINKARADRQFEAIASGDGFYAFTRNIAEYTIRLVGSSEGNIESYRPILQQTALELSSQTGMYIQVAAGSIVGDPQNLNPPEGEIWVVITADSPCGQLAGGTLGCGGPYDGVFVGDEFRLDSGTVWLAPGLANKCYQAVANHEVGHALGLEHFDAKFLDQYQVMRSSTACTFSAYRSGDLNGMRWLIESDVVGNDNLAGAFPICPYKDTTRSTITWFATKEAGEPAHAGIAARRSVWYRWTAEGAGSTTIRTQAYDFDTVLAVYSGSMFGGAVAVASNDDKPGGDGLGSQVTFNAVIGTTYWIAIDGTAPGAIGRGETDVVFDIPNVSVPTAPAGVPQRLLDTRDGGQTWDCDEQAIGHLAAGTTKQLKVTSRAIVPANATSVVLNVTALQAAARGYLTVYPCGTPQPNSSNLNFGPGETIPNLVIAKVGTGGNVCFFTSVETGLLVDVSGSFLSTGPLKPLDPARLLDTRTGGQTTDGQHAAVGRLLANVAYQLPVLRGGVLATAKTVVLNVTAATPSGRGYLSVYPCLSGAPNASSLNFAAGDVIPNSVLASVDANGNVCFLSSVATDLLVDVSGYFNAPPGLTSLSPARLLDTRAGGHTVDMAHQAVGRVAAGSVYELPVIRGGVGATATTVVLNVTVASPSANGYLTVFPCGSTQPNSSNLNFIAGDVIPNAVIANVGAGGKVCLYSSAQTDLLVDVSGYFAP